MEKKQINKLKLCKYCKNEDIIRKTVKETKKEKTPFTKVSDHPKEDGR